MTTINSITLDAQDPSAAEQFYKEAFDLGDLVRVRHSDAPATGFPGFVTSLIVAQPASAIAWFDSAIAAGATSLKPAAKTLWGFGGVLQAPDGTIWKVASASKKDKGPASREIEQVIVLLGPSDTGVSKQFYVERGFTVGRSIGKYVDFKMPDSPIALGLLSPRSLAKDAGVSADRTGSPRISFSGDAGTFTDPDGFRWTS